MRPQVDYLWQAEQERQAKGAFLTCSVSADAGKGKLVYREGRHNARLHQSSRFSLLSGYCLTSDPRLDFPAENSSAFPGPSAWWSQVTQTRNGTLFTDVDKPGGKEAAESCRGPQGPPKRHGEGGEAPRGAHTQGPSTLNAKDGTAPLPVQPRKQL